MVKRCIVCGAEFNAPPSSKKITCSKECSVIRKRQSHAGVSNSWSSEARKKWSAKQKAGGFSANAQRGVAAALALPEGQRGPQNRGSKHWVLIDLDGHEHHVINLKDWARRNAELFDTVTDDNDRERVANNIKSGFAQIVRSMQGKRKDTIRTYKGWRVIGPPKGKKIEEE